MKRLFLVLFISILSVFNSFSAQFISGFITYKHIDGNKFRVIYETIRDCRGTPISNFTLTVYDGYNKKFVSLARISIEDITLNRVGICSPNNKPGNQGQEKHTFIYDLDLDSFDGGSFKSVCQIYFGVDFCCRNSAIDTYSPGNGFVECMMDRCLVSDNSGPISINTNSFYVVRNNPIYFNPMSADTIDKDLLIFELATPLNGFSSPEQFTGNYSNRYPISPLCNQTGQLNCSASPLNNQPRGLYHDSINGNLIFTPTSNSEVTSFVYKIKEYRYINGVKRLIGYYYLDQLVIVQMYADKVFPTLTKNTLKLNHTFKVGETKTIKFDVQQSDTFKVDSVRMFCFNPIDGSSISINQKWRPEASFTWTPKCEDYRKEPYILLLYFYNENYYVNYQQSIAINIYVEKDLDIGNDTVICKNGTFDLKSNIQGKYKWNGNNADTFQTFQARISGKHWIDVDRKSCILSDTIYLKELTNIPKINLGLDTVVCNQPENSAITISTIHEPYVKYRWNIDTSNTNSFIYYRDSGILALEGENVCGKERDTIYISRDSIPQMSLGEDTLICDASSFDIHPKVKGNGFYYWNDGSTGSSLNISQEGIFHLKYENVCGSAKDTIEVKFLSTPNVFLGNDTIICKGAYPTLKSNFKKADYLWSDGSTKDSLLTKASGIYSVTLINQCGVVKDTIEISEIVAPKVKLGTDTSICLPISLYMNAYHPYSVYSWNTGDTTSKIYAGAAGLYHVRVENKCGFSMDSITINPLTIPLFQLQNDTALKIPFTYRIGIESIEGSCIWNTGDTTSKITVNQPGTYILTISNECGSSVDSVTLSESTDINTLTKFGIKIFPIPTDNILNIETETNLSSIEIYDVNGRLILQNNTDGIKLYTIDLSELGKGIYIIKLNTLNGSFRSKILVSEN